MVKRRVLWTSLASVMFFTGCVIVPTAPSVMALPGSQKDSGQFRADEATCRNYSQAAIGGPSQAATNNAAANAVAGSAIGAAAGAIIGSATGQAGPGAAIGAGTGLLFGSAAGANYAGYSSYDLQRQYDAMYLQCMYAQGNRVPARFVGRGAAPGYPAPGYPAPGYASPYDPPPYYRPWY